MSVFIGNKKTSQKKTNFRFIPPPTLINGHWTWKGLRVGKTSWGGKGLFATEHIEPGLIIPYPGVIMTKTQAKRVNNTWQFEFARNVIDGNPSLPQCVEGYCIAAFTNEPSVFVESQKFNCKYQEMYRETLAKMPEYRDVNKAAPFLVVMCPLAPKDELLVYYGDTYEENRRHSNYQTKIFSPENYADPVAWDKTTRDFLSIQNTRAPFLQEPV